MTASQPADQAALREIAAQAIRDAACAGDCGETEEECAKERIQPFAWQHGKLAVVEGSPEQLAAAVLAAVLPATTGCLTPDYDQRCQRLIAGRAAVVHEAVRRVHAEHDDIEDGDDDAVGLRRGLAIAEDVLRRMADETPAAETEADTCRTVDIDGQTISVRGSQDFTDQDRKFFGEVVRAAKRRYAAEHPDEPAAGARQVGAQQPGLRERHRVAWKALTPDEQAARLAELDADDEQDGAQR